MLCEQVKKINVIHNTSSTASSAYLLDTLVDAIGGQTECYLHSYNIKFGAVSKIKHFLIPHLSIWRDTARSNVLLIHTSTIFSLTQVLIAKLTLTKVVVILWDVYPESFISFKKQKHKTIFTIYAALEKSILRAADLVLLPSEDYKEAAQNIGIKKGVIFPLWPFSTIVEPITKRKDPKALHIGFAGSLNPIRGLPDAIQNLGARYLGNITLHLYSSGKFDVTEEELPQNIKVVEHGFIDQNLLVSELRQLDAGLVCLNPSFDQPAFPSKIISYVSSGIPVIYHGPELLGVSSFLERYCVGISLSSSSNLASEILSVKSNFTENQKKALSYLELTEEKLAQIL